MAIDVEFSLQKHARDNAVRPKTLDWPNFIEIFFTNIPVRAEKLSCTAFVPATFIPYEDVPLDENGKKEGHRKDDYVLAVTCLVIDIDEGLTRDRLDAFIDQLNAMGVAYVLHYTYSCFDAHERKQEYKVRTVIPLKKPVPRAEWPAFWEKARAYFSGVKWDAATKNTSRLYYLPAAPSREARDWMLGQPWLHYNVASEFLDPDVIRAVKAPLAILANTRPKSISSTPLPRIQADLRNVLRRLQGNLHQKRLAMALEALLDGHEYATEGARNETMTSLAYLIAGEYVDEDSEKLAQLFAPSQDLMAHTQSKPPDTLEQIADSISRAQAKLFDKMASKREVITSREGRIMQDIAGVADSTYRYTDDDMDDMAVTLGVTRDALPDHFIMMHPSAKEFFVLTKKGIRKYTRNREIWTAIYKQLLPTGIPLEVPRGNKTNRTFGVRPLEDVVKTNGTVLEKVAFDNRIATHRLTEDRTLLLPCARAALRAQESPIVSKFLSILFGEYYDKAKQWLAWFPETTDPIAALVLQGEAGIGKTLLAMGLGKIWAYRTPITFETAIDKFNYDLVNMPLVVADERLPSDHSVDKHLPEFVTTCEFFVQQKGLPMYPCYGYRRLIIASNSPQIVSSDKQDLTLSDLNALRERMWEVTGNPDARSFLESLGFQQRKALIEHEIAEHVLHLNKHEKGPRSNGRLAVSGSGDVGKHIVLSDNPVLLIFQMLMAVMDKARSGHIKHEDMIGYKWGGGEVAINNEGVTKNPVWEDVVGKFKPVWPSPGKQLRKASVDDVRIKRYFHGVRKHCFIINTDLFYTYLDEHVGVDVDMYRAMIDGAVKGE